MKKLVILVILLIISIPISFAKEVSIPELFTVTQESVTTESLGKEVYYYAHNGIIASSNPNLEYTYNDKLGSDFESKTLPFGQPILTENRFSFTGKELDQELYYFGARYYDYNLGRFVSTDPVEFNHPYNYVENNPMNIVDPTGKDGNRRMNIQISEGALQTSFASASSDPDGGTYYDPLNYGGGGYMSAYAYAGITGLAVGGLIAGGVYASPYLLTTGTTILAHPMEAMVVGGIVASAIDPNPTSDYTPVGGDEAIGNMIGEGLRRVSILKARGAIAMDGSSASIKFVSSIENGLERVFKSGADDGTNILIHGDEAGDFLRWADDGSVIVTSADDAARSVARQLEPGETCVNLVSCYGSRGKLQRFTNALSREMGHPMTVRGDVSGKQLLVGFDMPFVKRIDYGTRGTSPLPWQSPIYRFGGWKVPAQVFSFKPTR